MSTGHTSASFAATAGSSAAEGATSTSMNRATSGSSRDVALERPVAGAARQGRRSEGIPLVFRGSRTPPGGDRRPPISGETLREGPLPAARLRAQRRVLPARVGDVEVGPGRDDLVDAVE